MRNAPTINLWQVQRDLNNKKREFEERLALVNRQLSCEHDFVSTTSKNANCELDVDVVCSRCDYVWY